ncbi:hypothetical protein PF005_g7075 [Phytophthora fragariae]|uniref:Uncharacterized protein n=1 Tax=Phytophthora fragariae TaxID=53985 RepID=A0A6A3ZR71_9STRA|nr:hypothetical protein PF003_g13874 [Phytophthora fragariae]KAE8939931.1 hypothetical protein PF009_g10237 [Phytophthora fragariae]KAE9005858.1 hypothetical protein PF011_g11854 [Phytophthora fragariae]KAE9076026.1 hypothetical protein PF007_g24781 [Phytophthora fragariae]KAE9076059.1 hypothetical protein PF010_g24056 [Phytophthora fragariae]
MTKRMLTRAAGASLLLSQAYMYSGSTHAEMHACCCHSDGVSPLLCCRGKSR